jgi:subtilisin family serine protease
MLTIPQYHNLNNASYYVIAIATSHVEFAGRVVQNIWPIPANTKIDRFHATHIAGTIGGNTVGISPAVSMYGLDVFNGPIGARDSVILAALEKVAISVAASGKPSVVNMSLGGAYMRTNTYSYSCLILLMLNTAYYRTMRFFFIL